MFWTALAVIAIVAFAFIMYGRNTRKEGETKAKLEQEAKAAARRKEIDAIAAKADAKTGDEARKGLKKWSRDA